VLFIYRTGKKWDDGKPEKSSSAIPSLKKRTIVVHLFLHSVQKQMNNKYPLFLKTFLNKELLKAVRKTRYGERYV
jgi:hypothetical protein